MLLRGGDHTYPIIDSHMLLQSGDEPSTQVHAGYTNAQTVLTLAHLAHLGCRYGISCSNCQEILSTMMMQQALLILIVTLLTSLLQLCNSIQYSTVQFLPYKGRVFVFNEVGYYLLHWT